MGIFFRSPIVITSRLSLVFQMHIKNWFLSNTTCRRSSNLLLPHQLFLLSLFFFFFWNWIFLQAQYINETIAIEIVKVVPLADNWWFWLCSSLYTHNLTCVALYTNRGIPNTHFYIALLLTLLCRYFHYNNNKFLFEINH